MALVLCLLGMVLLAAVGSALVLAASVETRIAANFRALVENRAAAVAALERALEDLPGAADWESLPGGSQLSSFVDGVPTGARTLSDGSTLNLSQLVNLANCGRTTTCTAAQMNAVTSERPWGSNNPRWRLFAFGPLSSLAPADNVPDQYLVVLLADDSSENDDDPLRDGAATTNPGGGIIALRAESFGSAGVHSGIVATVTRPQGSAPARFMSWHDLARLDRP